MQYIYHSLAHSAFDVYSTQEGAIAVNVHTPRENLVSCGGLMLHAEETTTDCEHSAVSEVFHFGIQADTHHVTNLIQLQPIRLDPIRRTDLGSVYQLPTGWMKCEEPSSAFTQHIGSNKLDDVGLAFIDVSYTVSSQS